MAKHEIALFNGVTMKVEVKPDQPEVYETIAEVTIGFEGAPFLNLHTVESAPNGQETKVRYSRLIVLVPGSGEFERALVAKLYDVRGDEDAATE